MGIARRLEWYLNHQGVAHEIIPHPRTGSSRQTARVAHVDEDHLAKSVLLEDERGYLLSVLPASRRVSLEDLRRQLDRRLELATEAELSEIFDDCQVGAVPPVGRAYGIPTVVDEALLHLEDVYFEAGEHQDLVHVRGAEFARLMAGTPQVVLSREGTARVPSPPEPLRGREPRLSRLDEEQMHVFSLRAYGAGLRQQPEYAKDGHTGMILVKTRELRVVLEAAKAGTRLATHVVHGPATLYVLSGALDVSTPRGTFRVGEQEMAVLPRDEKRDICSPAESLFVIALSPIQTPETEALQSGRSTTRPWWSLNSLLMRFR